MKEDGWFHTGDTAVIFPNGYGQIVGRSKDVIIRGGENIYPRFNSLSPLFFLIPIFELHPERLRSFCTPTQTSQRSR